MLNLSHNCFRETGGVEIGDAIGKFARRLSSPVVFLAVCLVYCAWCVYDSMSSSVCGGI